VVADVRASQTPAHDLPEKPVSLSKKCLTTAGGAVEYHNERVAGRVSRATR